MRSSRLRRRSAAKLAVKVRNRTLPSATRARCRASHLARSMVTTVLPVPAPPRTRTGPFQSRSTSRFCDGCGVVPSHAIECAEVLFGPDPHAVGPGAPRSAGTAACTARRPVRPSPYAGPAGIRFDWPVPRTEPLDQLRTTVLLSENSSVMTVEASCKAGR